jgi:hypothetical protein
MMRATALNDFMSLFFSDDLSTWAENLGSAKNLIGAYEKYFLTAVFYEGKEAIFGYKSLIFFWVLKYLRIFSGVEL